MVRCIRVPKKDAEQVRSELMLEGLLDRGHKIRSDGDDVMVPVLCCGFGRYVTEEFDLERLEQKVTDYRELVRLPEELRERLPTSFDVIGDVAIMKIPEDLIGYRTEIGEAVMRAVGVRTVMADYGVKGDLRIRELEQIAGTGTPETVHREYGVRLAADPSKVYFNPRLATERMRIASMVTDGEVIVDMFAGVAPFPVVICKHSRPSAVYAVDLNPETKRFMEMNIRMNKTGNIIPIIGDIRSVKETLPKADRVIMNLPQSAFEFLPEALQIAKPGGTIHLHMIQSEPDPESMIRAAGDLGHDVRVDTVTELKSYSPVSSVYVYDIRVIT
jgi:tRNA (guanine37-N1)-methyltransferase